MLMDQIWGTTTSSRTSEKFTETASMFTLGISAIYFAVYSSFDLSILGAQWIVYAGALIYLFSSICISAYLAVTIVNNAVGDWTNANAAGWARIYRNHAWLGNGLGLWEAFWALWFLFWAFSITGEAYWYTSKIVEEMFHREYMVMHEGTFGAPVDMI
jgi:hypothetical protein